MNLVQKVEQFVKKHQLLQSGDMIVAAVSGGIDSVVMLSALLALREKYELEVSVAHVNHGLRGAESDVDEKFVTGLAASHGLEVFVKKVDTAAIARERRMSVQEAAREVRYEFFSSVRDSLGYSKIATAHNADDNAETVLLNLSRGAGVRGLTGIPVMRNEQNIIRPLLDISRGEVVSYATERRLSYREDSSNAKLNYRRNFIRHSIIPLLSENVNPGIVATLNRTAELFRDVDQYLNEQARVAVQRISRRSPDEYAIDIDLLGAEPLYMQETCLLLLMQEFSGREFDFQSVKTMMHLTDTETGSSYPFGGGAVAIHDRNRLVFRRSSETQPFRFPVEPNASYEFDEFRFSSQVTDRFDPTEDGGTEFVDADRLGTSLVLRSWLQGDAFQPLGMNGTKKLSDFFVDAKVPLHRKDDVRVLESDGTIVWVCGKRIDERFKVSDKTRRILRLEYLPKSHAS